MLQPFELFSEQHLNTVMEDKPCYLVTQSYRRGFDHFGDHEKKDILVTDYTDHGLTKIHYNAVRTDQFAALLDMQKEQHVNKIKELLQPDTKYNLFWAVVRSRKELEERINRRYRLNMWNYAKNVKNWNIEKDSKLRPTVEVTFGELFIVLKHGSQRLRIKFEEIEAM